MEIQNKNQIKLYLEAYTGYGNDQWTVIINDEELPHTLEQIENRGTKLLYSEVM